MSSNIDTQDKNRSITKKRKMIPYLKDLFGRFQAKYLKNHYTNGFHKLTYYKQVFTRANWLGVPVCKCPLDLWIYQEVIYALQPEVIVETGTLFGGSALYFASLFDLLGKGEVITIDIASQMTRKHPRVTSIVGDSVSEHMLDQVKARIKGKSAMVILDSDHSKQHVLKELAAYSQIVTKDQYLVVEDTDVNGHPVLHQHGEGPMEAVDEFLARRSDFLLDPINEKFLMTYHPRGFLKRI